MPPVQSKPDQNAPRRDEITPTDHSVVIARHLANRFGLTPATAAVVATLAYPVIETWRVRA